MQRDIRRAERQRRKDKPKQERRKSQRKFHERYCHTQSSATVIKTEPIDWGYEDAGTFGEPQNPQMDPEMHPVSRGNDRKSENSGLYANNGPVVKMEPGTESTDILVQSVPSFSYPTHDPYSIQNPNSDASFHANGVALVTMERGIPGGHGRGILRRNSLKGEYPHPFPSSNAYPKPYAKLRSKLVPDFEEKSAQLAVLTLTHGRLADSSPIHRRVRVKVESEEGDSYGGEFSVPVCSVKDECIDEKVEVAKRRSAASAAVELALVDSVHYWLRSRHVYNDANNKNDLLSLLT